MRLRTLLRRVIDRIVSNPVLIVGAAVSAASATTDQSWKGYGTAIGAAVGSLILRQFVRPEFDRRDKQPDRSTPDFEAPPFPPRG